MKFDFERKQEPIARGKEKIIYPVPEDLGRVVAEFQDDREMIGMNEMKGRYYLSKILHLLFKKTIPDVVLVQKEEGKRAHMVMERAYLDDQHNRVSALDTAFYNQFEAGNFDLSLAEQMEEGQREMGKVLEADPRHQDFLERMARLGVHVDDDGKNFGYDKEGNFVYVDNNFSPWDEDKNEGKLITRYDGQALRDAIHSLGEADRSLAMRYFERLEASQKEAEAAAQKQ